MDTKMDDTYEAACDDAELLGDPTPQEISEAMAQYSASRALEEAAALERNPIPCELQGAAFADLHHTPFANVDVRISTPLATGEPRPEITSTNPKDAYGDLKAPVDLVPSTGVLYESMAFKRGARKYGPFNWREKAVRARVYGAAMDRHLKSWLDGEDYDYDPKTDDYVHHLAAVRACANIVLDALELGKLVDDRVPGPASGLIARMLEKGDTRP